MARDNLICLDAGDPFPEMDFQLTSGEDLSLPGAFGENYGVLLIYRGDW